MKVTVRAAVAICSDGMYTLNMADGFEQEDFLDCARIDVSKWTKSPIVWTGFITADIEIPDAPVVVAKVEQCGEHEKCPKCGRSNIHRRSGVHFDHEMRCPDCDHIWT